jgi:hypothetical protein
VLARVLVATVVVLVTTQPKARSGRVDRPQRTQIVFAHATRGTDGLQITTPLPRAPSALQASFQQDITTTMHVARVRLESIRVPLDPQLAISVQPENGWTTR